MPIEYVTDPRTGKVVAKGSLGFGQPVVPERPPAPRAKPKPKPKTKANSFWGVGSGGFSLGKLGNDLRYELNQLATDPLRSVERAASTTMRSTAAGIAFRQGSLGATAATANAVRAGIEWKQRAGGRKQTDYTTSPAGRAVDRVVDHVYRSAGVTPPSQMTPEEKGVDDLRSALTLGVAGGVGVGVGLKALSGVRFVGPAAQSLANAMNPALAQSWQGAASRLAFDAAVGEAVTAPLDYTATGGSAVSLVDAVLGTKLDPVKPGMAFPDAAAASFIPNVAFGVGLGGAFMGINRARKARSVVQQTVERPRAELEGAGLVQSDPDTGATAFTPEAVQGQSLREANAALEEKYGISTPEPAAAPEPAVPSQVMEPGGAVTEGELPTADPGIDFWAIDYDPELPEADVALSQIKNASDAELLDTVRSGGPVLQELDQRMATRQPLEPDPALSTELNTAPSDSLADPITPFAQQWQQLGKREPQQLINVLHPEVNPDLAARAQALTGKEWEELTPSDAVQTLQAAADDGSIVIPSRLVPGQQMMKTGDLKIDPARFQFKQGTDARGVQRGSSLEGVDRWNTDMEQPVEVWQDPADGEFYVVNGHNRFALAQAKNIPTLPIKEIFAESPEQAKTVGALSNIATGGGRPVDAAWFIKGAGISEPGQLEALGVPLAPDSGNGLSGFQLSRLPEDILRAVESGQIKERQGRLIGGSGADEASMRGAYRYLVENPGTTEGRLKGMLELSKQMTGEAQATGEQTDLLAGTDWDQTFNKQMVAVADLADEVATLLKREKRLFSMADANSAALEAKGSRIDKASAQQVAEANARAIDYFQRTWMETGPIRDLLNEGGNRVAAGENKGAIAKQIKNRLVGQLADLMGEQAITRADVVQEDLLAQAPQQLDELLPDDRQAMEMLAIQRAIQNGEVRPPETPIPDLPMDSGVDLTKVQRDLAENTITDDVVQAMADELELRDAYRQLDDVIAQETEKAARDAEGYDLKTFDEKKAAGVVSDFQEPPPGSAAAKRRAEEIDRLERNIRQIEQSRLPAAEARDPEFAQQLRDLAAKQRRRLQELTGQDLAPPEVFTFPADLAKSAPRYGMAKVEFASDLDRAAYMLRDEAKKSKGETRLIQALEAAGYNITAIRTHGAKVRDVIKGVVTQQTGSAAAPQKAMNLQVPEQGFGGAAPVAAKATARVEATAVEIPAGASRKITANTGEGRVEAAAQSLQSWTAGVLGQPVPLDQARALVKAKGAILDPDKIPGLDMDAARQDSSRGVSDTPAMQAVAQAYRQFYGVESPGLRAARSSSAIPPGSGIPSRLVDEWLFEKPDGWAASAAQQLMATKKPKDFTKREAFLVDFAAEVRDFGGEQRFRDAWLNRLESGAMEGAAAVERGDLDGWLATYSERSAAGLAKNATDELLTAMREGIRVSGISPERVKVLDQILISREFGPDEAYQAAKAWDPVTARIVGERPYGDAARFIDSRTAGLRVPYTYPSPLQDSIFLSLELQLSKTFGRGRSLQRRGRSMVGDAYHEAFHRLQEFLYPAEAKALGTPEAKAEMVDLIQKGGGTYEPGMDISEIQAESFAVWALRRFKARQGSTVQRLFSHMGELLNVVGAAVRVVRKKSPTLIDVFEDAWAGGIGERSEQVLGKLPNADLLRVAGDVDSYLADVRPDIAQRVQAEVDRRYAQVEAALDDWNNRNREGGC